jgi:drug/metabolite transporter (DMT)-like permease
LHDKIRDKARFAALSRHRGGKNVVDDRRFPPCACIQPPKESPVPSRAYLALIIATLCWGGNAVAGKLALGHVSPMVLTYLRWVFAVAFIFAISVPQLVRDWPVVKKNLPYFFGLGVIGYTSFNAFLYTALQYTSAINAAVIQAGIPMVIFALNFALFGTRVMSGQIIGFFMTIAGVALLASHGDPWSLLALDLNAGDAIMLLAVLVYAVYTIMLRWKPLVNWRTLMAIPALGALISSFPLMGWEVMQQTAVWPDQKGWIITLYTAIFASLLAQILYIKGVESIGPNRAGLFINLVPVFGTLLSVIIIGETLHTYQIMALLLTLGGIAVAERKKLPVP